MSSASTPPGWYPAPGDPPGTHRYWNGSEWTTGPTPMQQAMPTYGGTGPGQPAEWGIRAIAWLIDYVPILVVSIVVGAADSAALMFVAWLAMLGYSIWNFALQQGRTGQTIGKKQQGIKLVADATGQPVGPGMAIVRYLIAGAISAITCGVYGLLDYLWPLWDDDKKRLTDKIVKFSVVKA